MHVLAGASDRVQPLLHGDTQLFAPQAVQAQQGSAHILSKCLISSDFDSYKGHRICKMCEPH